MNENFRNQQMSRAFDFLENNLSQKPTLSEIAKASGASQFHFIRIFHSYTGETPFYYLRRERVVKSLQTLSETEDSITEVALSVGFETSSSFNKAFKKVTNIAPSEFRNLGKEQRDKLIYSLSMTAKTKEIVMNFTMNLEPEEITRESVTIYASQAVGGEFKDIAHEAWDKIIKAMDGMNEDLSQSEFLGVGSMAAEDTKKVCDYKAAFTIPTNKDADISGLQKEVLPGQKYIKFLLEGSYENIWIAFDKGFEVAFDKGYELAEAPCVEVYLNDPMVTPVDELLTNILIPIK